MLEKLERHGPISAGLIVVVALIYFRGQVVSGVADGALDFAILYAAIFDWSAIQTGFLFGIFGYIQGKNRGFIAEIKNTPEMGAFSKYQKTAIYLGFMLTFLSIPLMVSAFNFSGSGWIRFSIFCGWSFLATWAFFAFLRVAYIFGILVRVRDKKRVKG